MTVISINDIFSCLVLFSALLVLFSAAFYLYQSTVFTLIDVFPSTLFPVSLQALVTLFTLSPFRSHFPWWSCWSLVSSKALVTLWPYRSLISWWSCWSLVAFNALVSLWPCKSLISPCAISSIEPRDPRDPWYAVGGSVDDSWALRLGLILI